MATGEQHLNLDSSENNIFLNPRWPKDDSEQLLKLARWTQGELNLRGHVWVATSGSTADSILGTKLVAISKQALVHSAKAVNSHLQVSAKDIWAQVLPHFHVGGLGIEVRAAISGARVVPALKEQRWDAPYFYQSLVEQDCTLAALVPTQVYDLISSELKAPPNLRAIVVGGGHFEVDLYKKARNLGWPVLPSYGMTETSSQIATASLASLKEVEFPDIYLLPHAQARVNSQGFLEVQATSLMTCYAQWQNGAMRYWDPKDHGWFTTEDRGDVQKQKLQIQGRSKDYIKIGGEGTNVARLRSILESCALEINSFWPLKLTLVDMPSARLGSEIHIVSLLTSEETQQVLKQYEQKVLPFEKARQIHFLHEIPRSDLGKILWSELRRML